MKKLVNLLRWIDDNIIKILTIGYIFLIPLYPKLPIKMINYTYIAIRFEDIYVTFLCIVFLIQLIRKKLTINKKFLILSLLFWAAVGLSFLFGTFIQKTIIFKHLGFLHSLRRVEYMIIFFVISAIIKSEKDFYFYLSLIMYVLLIVVLYGLGQKFFGFPAVQTMNDEFAKGRILFLTPEARVSSTFGGHYDLAAYLVLLLPMIFGTMFYRKQLLYFFIFPLGLFVLTLTASRVSYIAYIFTVLPFLLFRKKFKYLIIVILLTVAFTYFSKNLTSRFFRTFQLKQIFVNEKTGQVFIPQTITTKELPAGSFYIDLQPSTAPVAIPTSKASKTNAKIVKEQIRQEIQHKSMKSTGQYLTNIDEEKMVASITAQLKAITSVISDISFATRLQVEWPRALAAFSTHPIFGSGPSSITEATDNDYFRWLGEFGLLGTTIFLILLFQILKTVISGLKYLNDEEKIIVYSYIFGFFAILINAGYIDVFEASKVAFTFWLVTGLMIGFIEYKKNKPSVLKKKSNK